MVRRHTVLEAIGEKLVVGFKLTGKEKLMILYGVTEPEREVMTEWRVPQMHKNYVQLI